MPLKGVSKIGGFLSSSPLVRAAVDVKREVDCFLDDRSEGKGEAAKDWTSLVLAATCWWTGEKDDVGEMELFRRNRAVAVMAKRAFVVEALAMVKTLQGGAG